MRHPPAWHRRAFVLALACGVLLAGCDDRGAAPEPSPAISQDGHADLKRMRFAVAVFIGHLMLQDRARDDLAAQGFTILKDGDPRLQDHAITRDTLWFTFHEIHISGSGTAVEMEAKDAGGEVVLHARAKRSLSSTALDDLVAALAPYRAPHAAAPPHKLIEL